MFHVIAKLKGERVTVSWLAGEIRGDPAAVAAVRAKARELEGRLVGPVCGPYTETDHLSSALSAIFVMDKAFDEILETSGDVPEAPAVPPGAVA